MGRSYLIHDGTLFDGRSGHSQHHRSVLVCGDRIAAVGPAGSVRVPENAQYVDARGRTILPGLIDAHLHIAASGDPGSPRRPPKSVPYQALEAAVNARELLVAGFVAARDAGAGSLLAIGLREAISAGLVAGPRLQASGQGLSPPGGRGDDPFPPEVQPGGRCVVASPQEAREAAREQLRAGADCIKVYATGGVLSRGDGSASPGLTVEEMRAAIEEAHSAGAKVLAHAQGAQGIKNAVRAGADSVEHGIFLDEEAAGMMVEHGVFLVPTLSAVDHLVRSGERAGVPDCAVRRAKAVHDAHLDGFRRAVSAGVKVALGTDAGTPGNYHGRNALELELMCAAGMTRSQALMSATRFAAELMGLLDLIGTIEPGKLADVLLVGGDVLEDIGLLQDPKNIHLVMKGGELALNRGVRIGCLEPEEEGGQVAPA